MSTSRLRKVLRHLTAKLGDETYRENTEVQTFVRDENALQVLEAIGNRWLRSKKKDKQNLLKQTFEGNVELFAKFVLRKLKQVARSPLRNRVLNEFITVDWISRKFICGSGGQKLADCL